MTDKVVKRETLGQQILDNHDKYAGQKTQTVRETTNAMGKDYMRSLWKLIEDHKNMDEPYYIMEIMRPDPILPQTIHVKHIARRTRPRPEWGIALYKVDNKLGECFYEWGLPHAAEALIMVQNPEGWDSKTIKDIKDFVNRILV